jgi:hypothetical protein
VVLGGLEDLEGESTEEGCYLVFYDFKAKPSLYFYKSLEVIQGKLQDGVRIQKSVVQCRMLKTARAIEKLCGHYGAQALLFRAERLD